jgi:hypothetical protein
VRRKPDVFFRIKMFAVEIASAIVFLVFLYTVTRLEIRHILGMIR